MLTLESSVQYIKGVGPKMAHKMEKLGIKTVNDLISYYPRNWLDLSKPQSISSLRIGQEAVIKVKIDEIQQQHTFKKRISIVKIIASDESGQISLVWFNQPYLINNFKVGQKLIIYGKVNYDFKEKEKILMPELYNFETKILPIYSLTSGITSKYLRKIIKTILDLNLSTEFLPENILKDEKLLDFPTAIQEIHFPNNKAMLEKAKKRLSFNELFLIILKMSVTKKNYKNIPALPNKIHVSIIQKLINQLPYQLTNAQRKTSWEILQDLSKPLPMNRILQGDVGSGKTIVAIIAALVVIKNGYQVVWMAPTEILARQHYENVSKLLKPFNIKVAFLTSSSKSKLKTEKLVIDSELTIGTHALIQDKVFFNNLGLVIIDEQHRFGVKQRAALLSKHSCKTTPHFLSMTATPIPRTLALTIYGDLDISIINEMPKNRKTIITKLVDPTNRNKAYEFIRQKVQAGRQAFVICPLIEERIERTEVRKNLFDMEKKSVVAEYKKLSEQIFPDLKIAMLHGKLKAKEKTKIMQDFKNKKIDIIVSTSVVEVGVDVPNAAIIVIEDADRFGLSQLHQFRGRVGRSEHQSYCLLFTNSLSPQTTKRLKYMVEFSDGLKLAEKDMEIRGPGQLSGNIQHGLPDLKIASLTDTITINQARSAAEKVITKKWLDFAPLKNKLNELEIQYHLE